MAGGLAALLDDIAVIAKMTSVAGTKAVGVVVDDAAVTPQYVRGFEPARELPIIWRIARGSLVNKAILIVVLLLLDHFLPWVLTPLLMLGGLYLCFEGAEKLYEAVFHRGHDTTEAPVTDRGEVDEKKMVRGAITTDFILSAEIMVISLNTVNESGGSGMPFGQKAATLVVVALAITLLVYGVVALIVKMDDVGLHMTKKESESSQRTGRTLVAAMPKVLTVLSTVGIAAMLWVGGHILLNGFHELGKLAPGTLGAVMKAPYDFVHHLEEPVKHIAGVGGFLGWLVNTFFSAIVGLVFGGIIVAIMHVLPFGKKHDKHGHDKHDEKHDTTHGH
ncbi:DUF808 domain-containing protein [Mariniluteicoccus flavus]